MLPIQDHFAYVQRNSESDFRTLFAGFGTVFVLTVIWLALYIPWPDIVSLVGFDGEPLKEVGANPIPQKRGHQIGMLVLAALGITVLFLPSARIARLTKLLVGVVPYVAMLLGLSVALLSLHWIVTAALPSATTIGLHGGVFGAFAIPSRTLLLAAMAGALLFVPILAVTAPRQPPIALWSLAIAYSAFLLGTGFFGPILLDGLSPTQFGYSESHFDAIVGFGYTPILNLLQVSLERFTGQLSFATEIRIQQAGNVAFVSATLWAAYLWNPAKPLVALLTLGLVLPWVHNDFLGILFPNQAGWRYIAVPLAVVVVRLAHGRKPEAMALAFGLFGAWAVLWNAETGVAVVAGLLVRLAAVVERVSLRELSPLLVRFLAGTMIGVACVLLLYRVGLGHWPDAVGIALELLARTLGLNRGRPMYVDPLAILVGAYALWFVLRAAAIRRLGPVASKPADRAALGMIILVWGAYFMRQPHPWNLWSYMLLFGLLLGDTLFSMRMPRNWRQTWKQTAVRFTIPVVAFAFIVAPTIAAGNYQAVRSVWHAIGVKNASSSDAPRLSAVTLPREVADSLEERLHYLATVPPGTWVFTENVYLLPKLSERRDLNIVRSVYWKATLAEFKQLVDEVRSSAPAVLLFDHPAGVEDGAFIKSYFLHLQKALTGQYRCEKIASRWSVWRRNSMEADSSLPLSKPAGGVCELP